MEYRVRRKEESAYLEKLIKKDKVSDKNNKYIFR